MIAVSAGMMRGRPARLPGVPPGPGAGRAQRHRHGGVRPGPGHRRARARSASTRPAERRLRRTDHPPEGPVRTCCGPPGDIPAEVQLVLLAGAPDTPEIAAEVQGLVDELREPARQRRLGAGDAAQAGGHPGADARHGVRLPVRLRAAGHRQPGGDGLRDRRGRHRHRRHPRGRRRRRDRPAGADRAGHRRHPGWTRTASSRTWRRRSTNCSRTRPGPATMGRAGRQRAVEHFSWAAIAERTVEVYRSVL